MFASQHVCTQEIVFVKSVSKWIFFLFNFHIQQHRSFTLCLRRPLNRAKCALYIYRDVLQKLIAADRQQRCYDDARDKRRLKSNKRPEGDFSDVYICAVSRNMTLKQSLEARRHSGRLWSGICQPDQSQCDFKTVFVLSLSGQYRLAPRSFSVSLVQFANFSVTKKKFSSEVDDTMFTR